MAAAVSIIYSSDGESWIKYFSDYLQLVFSDINVESIQDKQLHQVTVPNSKVQNAVDKAKVNIFIVSPGYIQFLIANSELTIHDVLKDRKQTVIFLCGTTLDDLNVEDSRGKKITDRFPPFSERCVLSYPQHDEMLERVVKLLEPDPRSSRDETTTSGGKGDSESGTPKSPQHKLKRKSKRFKFMPNNAHCENEDVTSQEKRKREMVEESTASITKKLRRNNSDVMIVQMPETKSSNGMEATRSLVSEVLKPCSCLRMGEVARENDRLKKKVVELEKLGDISREKVDKLEKMVLDLNDRISLLEQDNKNLKKENERLIEKDECRRFLFLFKDLATYKSIANKLKVGSLSRLVDHERKTIKHHQKELKAQMQGVPLTKHGGIQGFFDTKNLEGHSLITVASVDECHELLRKYPNIANFYNINNVCIQKTATFIESCRKGVVAVDSFVKTGSKLPAAAAVRHVPKNQYKRRKRRRRNI